MSYAISSKAVFDGEQFLSDHSVIIDDERIVKVIPTAKLPASIECRQLTSGFLAPGFIDLQVNGGGGVMLTSSPSRETVEKMAAAHRRSGTTAMMPTLISASHEQHIAGVAAVASARQAGNDSILGVHIEGPFFAWEKCGAHDVTLIRDMDDTDLNWLTSLQDFPVILTLAPECTAPGQIRQLNDAGIVVCAGHSNASYRQVASAIDEGLQGFTHLYNAMSTVTAREPGCVGAALDFDSTWAGIIADGHHVDAASIRIAHRAKTAGKLVLVTDAMATVGSDTTSFQLYGETICERDGKLINDQGVLAGSAIGMIDAVRFSHHQVGIELEECLKMASLYPAQVLDLDHQLGRIATGYRPDLVHIDAQFKVHGTWVAGNYQSHSADQH
ncbi:MAG: N-acetylglucosamine-6-phosphate deacetylase [Halioglobus sp.]